VAHICNPSPPHSEQRDYKDQGLSAAKAKKKVSKALSQPPVHKRPQVGQLCYRPAKRVVHTAQVIQTLVLQKTIIIIIMMIKKN
jgi:hypothetical protein